jgi:signal transduction histidine kinase/CheY-like chemotaxis protein
VNARLPLSRWPLARLEALIRATSLACGLVLVAATVLHAIQLRSAIRAAAEARLLTVSRILAKEVNRTLLQTRGLFDQVDEEIRGGEPDRMQPLDALLESMPRQQTLLREIAVLDPAGRVVAASDRRRLGLDLSGLDFARVASDDGRLHVGVPKSGRGPAAEVREGPEHASTGWITLSRRIAGQSAGARVVAVIGADSLIGDLQFVSSDADLAVTLYRYDGALLAASDPAAATRRAPHPVFTAFLPDRETGGFEDRSDDAQRWMAHFDTAADFPVVVEVRMPRAAVLARWESELVAPALVMLFALAALVLYTRMTSSALRLRARSEQQLREARDAAESAASAKARFLAMMSHELRTPMTGILGMTELLHETSLDDGQRRIVEVLDGSARSLLTVLNDVLDYSKIDAGKLRLESIDFRPDAVLGAVASLLAPAASARGNALAVRWPDGDVPALRGDPTRLRQLLVNLVGNAIKFTERGAITVTGRTRPIGDGRIELAIAVADTGVGIATDVLPTLFRPFQQADTSTTRRFGGSGLGLAICHQLVEAMDGTIEAESRPGRGSTFRFAVPLAPAGAEPAEVAPALPPDAPRARGLRILVAEDNPTNRLLVGMRLGRAMHRVDLVENGRQALESVRARDYDLVLMDMQMPELDGVDATRAIRALPGPRGRTPIVALTADALQESRERYLSVGLDDCLTKPIDWNALERVLLRFAPPAPVPTDAGVAHDAGGPDSASVAAMREELGDDVWTAAAAIYWPSAQAELDACGAAVAAGDAGARRAHAHALRGASANLGLESVAARCETLERCPEAEAARALAALRDAFAAARSARAPQGIAAG